MNPVESGRFVENALDQYIATLADVREWDGKYHPSSLWGCTRQVIYNVRGVPTSEDIDLQAQRRFYIGHRLHEIVQQAIDLAPSVHGFYPEFRVDWAEMNITGHGDGLILFEDGTWCVLEVKSIRKSGFRYGLREENLQQAKTYSWAVRVHGVEALSTVTGQMEWIPPLGDKLRGILVVYLEKEDLLVREHWISWKNEFAAENIERIAKLDSYRNEPGSLPPRLPLTKNGKKDWHCRFCPFQTKCWTEDPPEIPVGEVELPF